MPSPAEPITPKRVPHWLRRPYEYCIYMSALTLFAVGGLLFSSIAFLLHFILPRDLGKRIGRRSLTGLFRFFVWYCQRWGFMSLDLEQVDALAEERGIIIAPNHIMIADVVFIISRIPDVVCIAKASVMRNPMYGGFARLAQFIPNDSPAAMVKQAVAELKGGARLLVFPEGTRMEHPPIQPFKGGFALIAKKAAAPIHTLFVSSNSAAAGKRWPIFKAPRFPYRYRIRRGQRFEVPADLDTKSFIKMLETYFRDNLPPDPRDDP